ncbi:AraC family transcriptional regulator [Shewanella electrodiphila]|uniref:AraC family transcriptional regulator n=1 Tax=Shewanella electrodiphila TaxID=934143 RepID=A0ABT0KQP7_9GAMM|nr:AraC family transcriptional regulator [Shewanella electrodiphila]MCL1046150.1 AraC family transcriptional regulator [Shewanella electrodiphila]
MKQVQPYTTLASWPMAVSRALEAQGIDAKPLLAEAGIDIALLKLSPEERIPVIKMTHFWKIVEQKTANQAFGLTVGEFVHSMNFRALGLLFVTCQNLAEALEKLIRYQVIISDSVNTRLIRKVDSIGLVIEPLDTVDISPLAIDAFFSSLLKHCHELLGDNKLIERIELMRSAPENPKAWKNLFNCSITFDAEYNAVWMKRESLEQPTNMGDVFLAHQNEQVVLQYLEKMQTSSWAYRTSQIIHKTLVNNEPTLASVAAVFNITERTLSRRLKEEQTSFRLLLQHKRIELAEYYLSNKAISITEITFNLGFTDISNFSRAFQRWKNQTPTEYRAQIK